MTGALLFLLGFNLLGFNLLNYGDGAQRLLTRCKQKPSSLPSFVLDEYKVVFQSSRLINEET